MLFGYCLLSLLTIVVCRDVRLEDTALLEGESVIDEAVTENHVVDPTIVDDNSLLKSDEDEVKREEKRVEEAIEEVKVQAREAFQQMFGLSEPVTRHKRQVPPQFMTELYKTVADPRGIARGKNPFDATVVRSFMESDNNSQYHFFSFNISGLSANEKVLEAELHLFRLRASNQSTLSTSAFTSPNYLIRVFQVVNKSRLSSPDIHRLLNVHYVGAHESGWQVFNVKAAVVAWVSGASPNHGLLVTVTTVFGDHVHMRFARRDEQHNSKQPILVLFDDDATRVEGQEVTPKPNPLANYPSQYKYQVDDTLDEIEAPRQRRSVSQTTPLPIPTLIPTPHNTTALHKAVCSRHELVVNFAKLGWNDWIIAPDAYNAYHCQGRCHFPLRMGDPFKGYHAMVQILAHKLHLNDVVEQPCCAPIKLEPLVLLYINHNDSVVIKSVDNMIATSCGCQ